MPTTIISQSLDWTPVEINIKFETREQLAAFLDVYGTSNYIASCMVSVDAAHATKFAKNDESVDVFRRTQRNNVVRCVERVG